MVRCRLTARRTQVPLPIAMVAKGWNPIIMYSLLEPLALIDPSSFRQRLPKSTSTQTCAMLDKCRSQQIRMEEASDTAHNNWRVRVKQ